MLSLYSLAFYLGAIFARGSLVETLIMMKMGKLCLIKMEILHKIKMGWERTKMVAECLATLILNLIHVHRTMIQIQDSSPNHYKFYQMKFPESQRTCSYS